MSLKRALQLDALDSSHPIEVPVGHPAEIDEIFDAISYEKGNNTISDTKSVQLKPPLKGGFF